MRDALIDNSPAAPGDRDRLSSISIEDYYNPYRIFQWPVSSAIALRERWQRYK